jgi:hypothetical protein
MSMPVPDKENLTEYRLNKLETTLTELVSNLSILRDIVLKWDARIGEGHWPLKCNSHADKIEEINRRVTKMEDDMDEMKKFFHKAFGALVVISIVIQLTGPLLMEKVFGNNKPVIELIEK